MNAKEKLMKIKSKGFFTLGQTFEEFISDLCKRYARIHGEILPTNDLDYIIEKLDENGYLEDDEQEIDEPVFV